MSATVPQLHEVIIEVSQQLVTAPRNVGFWGASSANMLCMIGIGPFLTIPLALAAMGGPQAMLGWILGAFLSLCDGMVWSELGSAMPRSGGPYYYLLEAFGPRSFGRLFSFLFLWQAIVMGPITIASGAVGFAQYAGYLLPAHASRRRGDDGGRCLPGEYGAAVTAISVRSRCCPSSWR